MKILKERCAGSTLYFVEFNNKEELDIFCRFIYNNDFFIRKSYKCLNDYKDYINNVFVVGDRLYPDSEYHLRLTYELLQTIDNYKRKTKLQNLNENR